MSFRHWTDQRAGLAEVARVLTPGAVMILADAFEPRRQTRLGRMARGSALRNEFRRPAVAALGFDRCRVDYVAGFGPIPEVAVVTLWAG